VEIIAQGMPSSMEEGFAEAMVRQAISPFERRDPITVLNSQGKAERTFWVPVIMPLVSAGELDAAHPGAEIVVSGSASGGDAACLLCLSGEGRELWRVELGQERFAAAQHMIVAEGFIAAADQMGRLRLYDAHGKEIASVSGIGLAYGLTVAKDGAGRPLLVVACQRGLYGFSVDLEQRK
jgi:hypothetical protein